MDNNERTPKKLLNGGYSSVDEGTAEEDSAFIEKDFDSSDMVNFGSVSPLKMHKTLEGKRSTKKKVVDPIEEITWNIWPGDDVTRVIELLDHQPDLVERRHGQKQETVLHRAARYGNKKVVRILLDRGATPCVRNTVGRTPLHLACLFNHQDIVKMLLEANAPANEKDDNQDEPIHLAAKAGGFAIISVLRDFGGEVCRPGYRGNTVLHYAAQKGRYDLLKYIVETKANVMNINVRNDVSETPLHLAAACYSSDHHNNVDVIELLLDNGADLKARTEWGDTAAHYAARYGTFDVLSFLCEEGISVKKIKNPNIDAFYEKHNIPKEEREENHLTLLQKVAKSSCIVKTTFVLDKMCDARKILASNMYYSNLRTGDEEVVEMNPQQKEFLEMTHEFNDHTCTEFDVMQMFLKYCPDSLNHLFDRCLIKPCMGQVQGRVYLDFFLFNPGVNKSNCASEMHLLDTLVTSGKERFLIHPVFEIFLKLKWYKTWTFYLAFLLLFAVFMVGVGGFALAYFGKFFDGQQNYIFQEKSFWWYFLVVGHIIYSVMTLNKLIHLMGMFRRSQKATKRHAKVQSENISSFLKRSLSFMACQFNDIGPSIMVGIVLYAPISEEVARYCMACSIILTCNIFMTVISRLPGVGLYVHMLTKVMATVLNFFATYFWSFAGYAIAFHILLPHITVFSSFPDAFIKVLTMLMGEYDYVMNFFTTEGSPTSSTWMAKIIFVIFVFDMSVVLMNLVLGLAISDIEELQRNSAVRRMVLETFTLMFIEAFFVAFDRFTGLGKFFSIRVTNDKSCGFVDVTFLELVDLDVNPNNKIITEYENGTKTCYECPHNIVVSVTKVLKARINEQRLGPILNSGKGSSNHEDYETILKNQTDILESIKAIKEKLGILETTKNVIEKTEEDEKERKKKLKTALVTSKWKSVVQSIAKKDSIDQS